MRPESRLLIVERLLPHRMECTDAYREIAMIDLHMLAVQGGRERSAAQFTMLLAAAGFELTQIAPTGSPFAIIESVGVSS